MLDEPATNSAPLIPLLVPDLPSTAEIVPWLRGIDARRRYTNFGPLERAFVAGAANLLRPESPPAVAAACSGTAALSLALQAANLPAGGRALVPALTFPATAYAIRAAGLLPVLADVDPQTWTLTPEITSSDLEGIDVVVPVAAFGNPLPADAWDRFVLRTGVPVVMDGAGAFGRQAMPRRCAIAFSLHATKPFGIGEGGLLASDNSDLVARAVCLSNFGFRQGLVEAPGGNAKLSEYHAAVGLAQLERWAGVSARFDAVLANYDALLPVPRQPGRPGVLVVDVPDAASVQSAVARQGIETRRWYQPDLSRQPAYSALPRRGSLDVCDELAPRLLGIPLHTALSPGEIARVAQALSEAIRGPLGRSRGSAGSGSSQRKASSTAR